MKLWLDDIRDPAMYGAPDFVWAKDYHEAVGYLKSGNVTFASLDHDLDIYSMTGYGEPGELTGYDVICWMENNGVWPEDGVVVHSMNPSGRARMEQAIRKHYAEQAQGKEGK